MKVATDSCLFGAVLASLPINQKENSSILDIGSGTGLLALMFAQKHPNALIDAVEIDTNAFHQLKENVEVSVWNDRIIPIHSDVKEYPFSNKYDCIFSNPPFYENELSSLDNKKNLAHHGSGLLFEELCQVL